MVLSLLRDVAVEIAPVESDLLLLFLIEPDEFHGGPRNKVMEALQVLLTLPRTFLQKPRTTGNSQVIHVVLKIVEK